MRAEKGHNRVCAECGEHRAIFKLQGHHNVHRDKCHDLCFRCFRSAMDSLRARLAPAHVPQPV